MAECLGEAVRERNEIIDVIERRREKKMEKKKMEQRNGEKTKKYPREKK